MLLGYLFMLASSGRDSTTICNSLVNILVVDQIGSLQKLESMQTMASWATLKIMVRGKGPATNAIHNTFEIAIDDIFLVVVMLW